MAEEGRQEEDDESTWTTRTGRIVFKKAGEHVGKKSVWTKGVRNVIRSQASKAELNRVWARAAERWVECVSPGGDESNHGCANTRQDWRM